jgi:hypothetical protein
MKNRNTNLGMRLIMGLCILGVVPATHAGSLEPSGPPGSTMKTLDQIPPTWDQILPAASRFQLVMGGAAVLDKETGLVWQKSPDSSGHITWYTASNRCDTSALGGRGGWRLPTIHELETLVDTTQQAPALPPGNPFSNVQVVSSYYWTTSAFPGSSTGEVYTVDFASGQASNTAPISGNGYAWCVRGG